jgi:hypothetical protein
MNELKINGIKGLVSIPDISLYILLLIIVFSLVLIGLVIYLIYKFFKNKNNPRKEYYQMLKDIDLSDTKKAAYTITLYAKKLVKDDRDKKLADELINLLDEYKYKKDVNKFGNDVKLKYDLFMENIDV